MWGAAYLASLVRELDEAEALELACLAVSGQPHIGNLASVGKECGQRLPDGILTSVPVKALHEYIVVVARGPCDFNVPALTSAAELCHTANIDV